MTVPGVYSHISNEEYHSAPGISKSGLDLIAKSPYLYRTKPRTEPTRAMLIGSAVHSAVLEPSRFSEQFVCSPAVNARTNAGKAELEAFVRENEGKTVLNRDDYQSVLDIAMAARTDLVAANILTSGQSETSVFHEDEHTGELVKVRPDWMTEDVLVDLKTTEDASADAFARSCWNYRYHVQAALYLDVVNAQMAGRFNSFVFVAVEKSFPHQVAVYYADSALVEAGRLEYRRNLNLYHQCRVSDCWPGLNENRIQPISLPYWALKQAEMAIAD